MKDNDNTCPVCGGETEQDEVDVGVGVIRGPRGCPACHWVEEPFDPAASIDPKPDPET
jgi:hypothetical protein